MRKWSKAPRILSLLAVMIAAAVGFAPAAYAEMGDVRIGNNEYASLPEAVEAIAKGKESQGETIKLMKDLTGPGVVVSREQKFKLDLGGKTYTVTDPTVGSPGTETNAFQLLDGSNLTFTNGTITTTSTTAAILIQNYANLTLEGVTLKGGSNTQYTLSNNSGNVKIGANTNIYAGGAGPKAAFDVCRFASYPCPNVVVATGAGEIAGKIELSVAGAGSRSAPVLNLEGGDLSAAVLSPVGDAANVFEVKKGPGVSIALSENHEWSDQGGIVKIAAKVIKGDEVKTYKTLSEAIGNADGATVKLLSDETESIVIPAGKSITLDLAGHKLTNPDGNHTIVNKGNLTVVDSAGGGVVDNVSHQRAALATEEGSVTALSGGTFKRSAEAGTLDPSNHNGNSYYTVLNHGKLTINAGSKVELLHKDGSPAGYSSVIDNGWFSGKPNASGYFAELILDGGVIDGGKYLKNDSYGVMVIKSGEVKNGADAAILNWNNLTVSGGTIDPSDGAAGGVFNLMGAKGVEDGKVVVSGGTFISTENQQVIFTDSESNTANDVEISGGTYKGAIPDEGYIVPGSGLNKNPDGSFGVHKHTLVAVAEVPATCDANGSKAHWKCKDCGALYRDKDMKEEVTDPASLVSPKLGHKAVHVPAKAATIDAEGIVEHWYCAQCDTYFADAKLTETMTKAETVVAKLPKEFTVTFESGAGKPTAVTVKDGALLDEPTAPTLKGWKFLGWFKVKNADGTVAEKWDFTKDAVTADITLYGGWVKADEGKSEANPTNKLPKTGDASMLPMMVAGITGAAALVVATKLRKR